MNLKKILACLLAMVMALSGMQIWVWGETDEAVAAVSVDETSDQYRAQTLLRSLEILPQDAELSGTVNRGVFAGLVLNLIRVDAGNLGGAAKEYYDVARDSEYYSVAQATRALQITDGYEDNTFRPENPVSLSEAVCMVLRAAGYRQDSALKGGYYLGYDRVVNETNVLPGVTPADDSALTMDEVCLLLYAALDLPVRRQIQAGETWVYTSDKDQTILSEIHEVYRVNGKITATPATALAGGEKTPEGIVIDGRLYRTQDPAVKKLIGYTVDCYYRETPSETAVCVLKDQRINELSISGQDVVSYQDGTLTYAAANGRSRSVRIDAAHDLIYNGGYITDYTEDIFLHPYSQVTLVSEPNTSLYTTVLVDRYFNYIVQSVSVQSDRLVVTPYYQLPALTLNLNDSDLSLVYEDATGASIADANAFALVCQADTVLSVFADRTQTINGREAVADDAENVRLVCSAATVEGTLESRTETDGIETVSIGGISYPLAEGDFFEEGSVTLGDTGIFLLDWAGRIVGAEYDDESVSEYEYAFLISASTTNEAISPAVQLKLLNEAGEVVVMRCKDPLLLNGSRYSDAKIILGTLQASASYLPNETGYRQVIKYKANGAGEISEMLTILQSVGRPANAPEDQLTREAERANYLTRSSQEWALGTDTWAAGDASLILYHKPVIYFRVPDVDRGEDEDYALFEPEDEEHYDVDVYDCSVINQPAVGVVYTDSTEKEMLDTYVVVDEVIETLDDEGSPVKMLSVHTGTGFVRYEGKETNTFDGLTKGDVVNLFGSNGMITRIQMIMPIAHLTDISIPAPPNTNIVKTELSEVYAADGRRILLQTGPIQDSTGRRQRQRAFYWSDNTSILRGAVLYDATNPDKPVIQNAALEDIQPAYSYGAENASLMLTMERYSEPLFLVIYNGV